MSWGFVLLTAPIKRIAVRMFLYPEESWEGHFTLMCRGVVLVPCSAVKSFLDSVLSRRGSVTRYCRRGALVKLGVVEMLLTCFSFSSSAYPSSCVHGSP